MKYFTKEELEDITKELVENPARETLKRLNEKYNGVTEPLTLTNEVPTVVEKQIEEVESPVAESKPLVNNEVFNDEQPTEVALEANFVQPIPAVEEQPIVNPVPNFNIPNIETPISESNVLNSSVNVVSPEIPTIELPKLDTSNVGVQNNEMVNFTGNLFEPSSVVPNLMQTTDNFNSVSNTMPTTEVPVTSTPFFGPHAAMENNPIPVSGGTVNNMVVNEPTMFGQIEQNYM